MEQEYNPFAALKRQLAMISGQLDGIEKKLSSYQESGNPKDTDLVPIGWCEELYGISPERIYHYRKKGWLNLYKKEGKTYFSKSEYEKAIKKCPI